MLLDGAPCPVAHAGPDKLWLAELPDTVKMNGQVTQPTLVGSVQDVFRAFGEEWLKSWLKHEVIGPAQWEKAHSIIHSLPAPPEPWSSPKITPEEWNSPC